MKLDQLQECKTPGVVIVKSSTTRSYVTEAPQNSVRRNQRSVRPTTSPIKVEKFAEVEPHVKVPQELCPKSRTADVQELPPTQGVICHLLHSHILIWRVLFKLLQSRLGQSSEPLPVVLSGNQSVFKRTFQFWHLTCLPMFNSLETLTVWYMYCSYPV